MRIVNYLSPGLPAALFEGVAEYLGRSLGLEVTLVHETLAPTAYEKGILLALRAARSARGVTVGLDKLIDLPTAR